MENVDHESVIIGGCTAWLTAGLYETRYGDVGPRAFCNRGL